MRKIDSKDASNWVKYCNYIWVGIPLLIVIWMAKMYLPDSDSFFLAATGRYIVETGKVPTINPFVIHDNLGIIVQQWITDILNFIVYDNFGEVGMYVWAIMFLVVSSILIHKYLGSYTNNIRIRNWVVVACMAVLFSFANTRPTSISLPLLLVELIILEKYNKDKKSNLVWMIPLLSLVLINCHSALWFFIFVMMLPYVVPGLNDFRKLDKFKQHLIEYKKLWLVMIPTFIAGFLNPNGIKGILYIYYSYSNVSEDTIISELQSPNFNDFLGLYLIVAVAFIAIYIYKYNKNISWKNLYLALGTFLLASQHSRNVWFILLGVTPLVVMVLDNYVKDTVKIKYKEEEYKLLSLVFTLALVVLFFIIDPAIRYDEMDVYSAPTSAVEYLNSIEEDKKDDIVLFTGFNNGAYLEWNGYKVYMDARPELFEDKIGGQGDIYSEYIDVCKGNIDYAEFLEKYGFTHLILDSEVAFSTYLKCTGDYDIVVDIEDEYKLFERKDF